MFCGGWDCFSCAGRGLFCGGWGCFFGSLTCVRRDCSYEGLCWPSEGLGWSCVCWGRD